MIFIMLCNLLLYEKFENHNLSTFYQQSWDLHMDESECLSAMWGGGHIPPIIIIMTENITDIIEFVK